MKIYTNNEIRLLAGLTSILAIILLPVEIPIFAIFAIFSKPAREYLVTLYKAMTKMLPALIKTAFRGNDEDFAAIVAVGDDLFGGRI